MEVHSIKTAQQFSEERFTKINIIKHRRSSVFVLNFLPGQHMKPHSHPGRELYLHVIEGTGIFLVDGEEITVSEGDVTYCDPVQQLGFTNNSDDRVSVYATMTKISDS